jgi:hypothetical protein
VATLCRKPRKIRNRARVGKGLSVAKGAGWGAGGCGYTCVLLVGGPSLDVLPVDVAGVVEMEEETFFAIEKASAEDVVVEEGERGVEDCVGEEGDGGLAGLSAAEHERHTGCAVSTHVFDVEREGGVLVVQHVVFEFSGGQ